MNSFCREILPSQSRILRSPGRAMSPARRARYNQPLHASGQEFLVGVAAIAMAMAIRLIPHSPEPTDRY
jgi:hypothetical protein